MKIVYEEEKLLVSDVDMDTFFVDIDGFLVLKGPYNKAVRIACPDGTIGYSEYRYEGHEPIKRILPKVKKIEF